MNENRCIMCNDLILDGIQVCSTCLDKMNNTNSTNQNKLVSDLKSIFKVSEQDYQYIASKLIEKGWRK